MNSENIGLTENRLPPSPQKEVKLVDIAISDENIALNVSVNFLILAHKRCAFGLDESAKIWECIKMFQKSM
jgi:hypothetical protein